jgi:hypothetical protein
MSLLVSFDGFVPQLRAFITRSQEQPVPEAELDAEFNRLAAALFALQRDAVPIYGEFCAKRKVSAVADWREIPALPAAAFKEFEVTSLPPAQRTHVFHSSGTTQHRPSRHFHNAQSLALYEESLRPWFRRHFLPEQAAIGGGADRSDRTDQAICNPQSAIRNPQSAIRNPQSAKPVVNERISESASGNSELTGSLTPASLTAPASPQSAIRNPQLIILTPSPAQAPHSSLAYMFDTVRADFGAAIFSGRVNGDGAWALDLEQTMAALREAQSAGQPVALLGTASSFVLLLDHCRAGRTAFRLAPGSRALETGGYKGRGRAAPKWELRQMMTRWLGMPESRILAEYGMSELSSQAYDRVIPEAGGGFRFPPWARARIISPETGREAAEGETGLVQVVDLANVRSALAVQTEDLAVRCGAGFELTGRAAGTAARGCSLMLAEL